MFGRNGLLINDRQTHIFTDRKTRMLVINSSLSKGENSSQCASPHGKTRTRNKQAIPIIALNHRETSFDIHIVRVDQFAANHR